MERKGRACGHELKSRREESMEVTNALAEICVGELDKRG